MNLAIVIILFLFSQPGIKGEDGPTIKWQKCAEEDASLYHTCMHVRFSNGIEDVMVLEKYMGYDSILVGKFRNDDTVSVALSKVDKGEWSGTPFLATFASINEPSCGSFRVSEEGKAVCYQNEAFNQIGNKMVDYIPIPFEEQQRRLDSSVPNFYENRALNPQGYNLSMMIFYDENFHRLFNTEEEALTRIYAVIAHANTKYAFPSLTTKVAITVVGVQYAQNKTWYADGNGLGTGSGLTGNAPAANSYMFLGFEDNSYGYIGIAYMGSTCASRVYRVAVVEYFFDDVSTAGVLAHELGHNLGMNHDFDSSTGGPRYASDGTPCTWIGGVMDCGYSNSVWSKCSVEDFTAYHDQFSTFCVPLLPATKTSKTSSLTTISSTTSSTTSTTTSSTTSSTTSTTTSSTTSTSTSSTTTSSTTTSTSSTSSRTSSG